MPSGWNATGGGNPAGGSDDFLMTFDRKGSRLARFKGDIFMRVAAVASVLIFIAPVAWANDKPGIGVAPAWVKRQAIPSIPAADGSAVRFLLTDSQTRFERDGSVSRYQEMAAHIQNSEGLAAGTITFSWRPEMDDVTVHQLQLRRGDKVIDVLATGKPFTVLRRETDLEAAKLDGVLTATLQIDGVEVGDVVLLAMSMVTRDPVLGAHAEEITAAWNNVPIERAHMRLEWPADRKLHIRTQGSLAQPKPSKAGGFEALELSMDKVQPEIPPTGAPLRFRRGRLVEASDFSSWNDIAQLLGPLYSKASLIPAAGSLRAEVDAIKASSTDPVSRAEAALKLVQSKIRYVALQMGANGLVPASAEASWASRYGDCKAKTALLIGLLGELGIAAEPVAVSTTDGDGMDVRLPRVGQFDHVLVRARINGRDYWLDGTRTGDTKLANLETPDWRWGLPLVPGKAQLVSIQPAAPSLPKEEMTLEIDASKGVYAPSPARAQAIFRGDAARAMHSMLSNATPEMRNEALKQFWKNQLDEVEPEKVSQSFDEASGTQLFTLEGSAKLEWDDDYWRVPWSGVGYKADFARTSGTNRDAPFAVSFPSFSRAKMTIKLPPGVKLWDGKGLTNVSKTLAGVSYERRATLLNGTFRLERSGIAVKPEVSYAQALADQAELRALDDADVYLQLRDYRLSEADLKVRMASGPKSAQDFIDRGLTLMTGGKMDEAIADFSRAHELDPKNAWALANRGLAHAWKEDEVKAKQDVTAARALDPKNAVAFRADAVMAMKAGNNKAAIEALTASLAQDPNNGFALRSRAQLRRAELQFEEAIADTELALKLGDSIADLRLLRANIYRAWGKRELAAKEAELLIHDLPEDSYAQVAAAKLFDVLDRRDEAMAAIGRAMAIKPEAYIYLNRADIRPKSDAAGRRADLAEALKLDPDDPDALTMMGEFEVEQKSYAVAIAHYTKAIAKMPKHAGLKARRGVAYLLARQPDLAAKDFEEARRSATTGSELNSICWTKATAGVDLEKALEECSTALAKQPDTPAYLDSRGLVYLRLGRTDDAIVDYSKALAKVPELAPSLYGRAIAYARKGDAEKSAIDRANAIKVSPRVAEEFANYGVMQ